MVVAPRVYAKTKNEVGSVVKTKLSLFFYARYLSITGPQNNVGVKPRNTLFFTTTAFGHSLASVHCICMCVLSLLLLVTVLV